MLRWEKDQIKDPHILSQTLALKQKRGHPNERNKRGLSRGGFPQPAHSLYIDALAKDQNTLH